MLDGDAVKFVKQGDYWHLPAQHTPNVALSPRCQCSALPGSVLRTSQVYQFLYAPEAELTPYFDDLDACNAFLAQQYAAGTPVTVEYELFKSEIYVDEPIIVEHPSGTTTVNSESGSNVSVGFKPFQDGGDAETISGHTWQDILSAIDKAVKDASQTET